MTLDVEIARKLLLSFLKSGAGILITSRAHAEARIDFGLTAAGIIAESIKNLEGGVNLTMTEQSTGSTGWVIKPEIDEVPAYLKFCIEDVKDKMIMTIVSAHKQVK